MDDDQDSNQVQIYPSISTSHFLQSYTGKSIGNVPCAIQTRLIIE
jgi:hypothetical protein